MTSLMLYKQDLNTSGKLHPFGVHIFSIYITDTSYISVLTFPYIWLNIYRIKRVSNKCFRS
jgi:hypothetical protein